MIAGGDFGFELFLVGVVLGAVTLYVIPVFIRVLVDVFIEWRKRR